jgi:hypothetical protein
VVLLAALAVGISACGRSDEDSPASDAASDGPARVDVGGDIWVSPERCPPGGNGVREGYPCGVDDAVCSYACDGNRNYPGYVIGSKCVAGVWTITKRTRCTL